MKVCGIDPAISGDYFALVYVETTASGAINVTGAKVWKNEKIDSIENQIIKIHNHLQFDMILLETNSIGAHILQDFEAKGLPVRGVVTVGSQSSIKEDRLNKHDLIQMCLLLQSRKELQFPRFASSTVQELKRQLLMYERKITRAGNISYNAPSGEHDDLVMALLLAVFGTIEKPFEQGMVILYREDSDFEREKRIAEDEVASYRAHQEHNWRMGWS